MYGELPELERNDGTKLKAFPVQLPNPPKTAYLRLPTSAEILTYMQGVAKSRSAAGGNGAGEGAFKADLALFNTLRLGAPTDNQTDWDWDAYEASYAINTLTLHDVKSCERAGQSFVVTLLTMLGPTTHTLNIPFQRQLAEYRASLVRGEKDQWFSPEASVRLYDQIVTKIDGYAAPDAGVISAFQALIPTVPPHHKRTVIGSVLVSLAALDQALDPNS